MPPKSVAGPNHMRLNHQQIKEQEAINRERQRQDEFEAERKRKIIAQQRAQYGGSKSSIPVGSRVAAAHAADYHKPRGGDDVEINVFVNECNSGGGQTFTTFDSEGLGGGGGTAVAAYHQQKPSAAHEPPSQQPRAVGRAPAASRLPPVSVRTTHGRAPPTPGGEKFAGTGEVPAYLKARKNELENAKAEALRLAALQAEQEKYPPGHRPVSEEERGEILSKLAARKRELEGDLGRLPMRYDTQAIATRRKQIETELVEVETAERKFGVKKQLFVPI